MTDELGDRCCRGRTADEPVLAATMAMTEGMAGGGWHNPNMRRACALETMDSLSSVSAWCYITRHRAHSDAYCAAAFFSFSTARRSLLLANSLSSMAADAGESSDHGFFATGGGSSGSASSSMVNEERGEGRGRGRVEGGAREGFGGKGVEWPPAPSSGEPGEDKGTRPAHPRAVRFDTIWTRNGPATNKKWTFVRLLLMHVGS